MVSHKYKFMFIHVGRTAGCSIERALCDKYCGDESQIQQGKWVLYKGCDSFYETALANKMDTDIAAGHWCNVELKSFFGEDVYDEYLKFTIVRNPWQRMLSQYKKTDSKKNGVTFRDWIINSFVKKNGSMTERFYKPCMWWISDSDGKNEMDYIIRYENLEEDFNMLLKKLGITDKIKLQKVNPLPKLQKDDDIDTKNYQNYYDEETKKIINDNFKEDIEEFGYEF